MSVITAIKNLRVVFLATLFCGIVGAAPAWSQSTDFSRPTPLAAVPLIAEHDGAGKGGSRYYAFEAGPGNILVTFDGHATRNSTHAELKFWDANRNPIGEIYLVAMTTPSSQTKRFNFTKRQKVVMELILPEDASLGVLQYSINMTGAVQLAHETTGGGTTSAASTGSSSTVPSGRGGTTRLRIEMFDGSKHEFQMSTVRRVTIE